jgi:uncharacterized damage-inducible protein DinB
LTEYYGFYKLKYKNRGVNIMTEQQFSLSLFYKGWDVYQQGLVAAIAPLTAEQLTLRSSQRHWSVGMIATHIVATRAGWFHTRMGEGSADMASIELWDYWDEMEVPVRSTAELVDGLERTWQMIQDALARWTVADLEHVFPAYYEGSLPRSRQYIIWHVLEHDIHHGGEISSILGAHGLAGVDLG